MSQYKTGTVTVTNASATVTGVGTSWLTEVIPNNLFILSGMFVTQDDKVAYTVAGVVNDTTIQLSAPYAGANYVGQDYVIHRGFGANGLPILQDGDLETAPIFNLLSNVSTDVAALGTAAFKNIQTHPTDNAPSDLVLLNGSWNLGTHFPDESASDLDDIIATQFSYVLSGTTNAPIVEVGTMITSAISPTNTIQDWIGRDSLRRFIRSQASGVWSAWAEQGISIPSSIVLEGDNSQVVAKGFGRDISTVKFYISSKVATTLTNAVTSGQFNVLYADYNLVTGGGSVTVSVDTTLSSKSETVLTAAGLSGVSLGDVFFLAAGVNGSTITIT